MTLRFWRRPAVRIRDETVRGALRGQPGVTAVESVVVVANDSRVPDVTVTLRVAVGANAADMACQVINVLHARLPAAQIHVLIADERG